MKINLFKGKYGRQGKEKKCSRRGFYKKIGGAQGIVGSRAFAPCKSQMC